MNRITELLDLEDSDIVMSYIKEESEYPFSDVNPHTAVVKPRKIEPF